MRRFSRIDQTQRYAWAKWYQKYRGTDWTDEGWAAAVPRRDNVNAGYWVTILGFRLVRCRVLDATHPL